LRCRSVLCRGQRNRRKNYKQTHGQYAEGAPEEMRTPDLQIRSFIPLISFSRSNVLAVTF